MPFLKLDCGILDSTLWMDRDDRDVFITALLMAMPHELAAEVQQIEINGLNPTGFVVAPGSYGFVGAAGPGIVRRAAIPDMSAGLAALERLGMPDPNSRSSEHEGRRMVRVDGGFIVLNFWKYRERDYTGAERQRRFRERNAVTSPSNAVTGRDVTHADAEAEEEENKEARKRAFPADADEKGWKKLATHLGLKAERGEDWNTFKSRIRRKSMGMGRVKA